MDEESQEPQSKISIVIWMVGFIVAIVFDVLSLIPLVGDIEEVPAGAVFVLNAIFGVQNAILIAQGAAMAIKAIPVVQWLPAWTGGVAFAWYIEHSSSKLASKIEEGAAIAGALEGENVSGVENEVSEASELEATREAGASPVGPTNQASLESGAGLEEETGRTSDRENARPSETSTERRGEEGGIPGEEGEEGEGVAEQKEGAEKEEEPEKEMETKAQRPPEEGAMEADFGPSGKDQNDKEEQGAEEPAGEQGSRNRNSEEDQKEKELRKRLEKMDERWKRIQDITSPPDEKK